jgi:hypothetical protein
VDWTPTQKDSLAFRYVYDRQAFNNQFPTVGSGGSPFPGFEVDVPSLTQNFFFNYTRNISARLTNEARFGYARFNVDFAARDSQIANTGPVFTFSGAGLGQGITSVGLPFIFPQGRLFNNYQIQDTLSYTAGNHTFRFGADLNIQRARQAIPFNSRGVLTFAGGGGFNSFGNFVDQFSGRGNGGASIQFGSPVIVPNAFYQNYFIDDSWRVTKNLTLNLGLRYENYGTPFNAIPFPAFAGFDQPVETVARQQRDNNVDIGGKRHRCRFARGQRSRGDRDAARRGIQHRVAVELHDDGGLYRGDARGQCAGGDVRDARQRRDLYLHEYAGGAELDAQEDLGERQVERPDAVERLLSGERSVPGLYGVEAGVAVPAGLLQLIPEVSEQHLPAAHGRLAVAEQ